MKFVNPKFCWFFILMLLLVQPVFAQKKKDKDKKKGNSEVQLTNRIFACLANEDAYCYLDLFPDVDTMTKLVLYYANPRSEDYREAASLQRQARILLMADSAFKAKLKRGFDHVIDQGKQQGMHWNSIIPVRYELVKARQTRDTLLEKLAPNRYSGYFFIMDGLTHRTYGYAVTDMLEIKEEWYGGYLTEIFEANTKDEYDDAYAAAMRARKHPKPIDTTAVATTDSLSVKDEDEVNNDIQKLIVERKFYTGMFDNEIPVQLYVRSLKGSCPEVICAWEAIYKFGDQDDYILLKVTRTAEGKWLFTEEPNAGSMELDLKEGVFTGTWTSSDGQTGYEVKLSDAPASSKKLERLEGAILDLKGFGKLKK